MVIETWADIARAHAVDFRDRQAMYYANDGREWTFAGMNVKGVELSHANFIHCLSQGLSTLGMNPVSVNIVCVPLFHISVSGWGVVGMYGGSRTLLLLDFAHGCSISLTAV